MPRLSALLALFLGLTLCSVAACGKPANIPGTQIPDSDENRAVINTLERYRIAMVQRDAAGVLSMAHPTYYDGAGTDDPGDDLTYPELGATLRARMAQLQSVRFTIDYLEVNVNKDRAVVKVWMDASFRIGPQEAREGGDGRTETRYARLQDYNLYELVRDGNTWLITSGL